MSDETLIVNNKTKQAWEKPEVLLLGVECTLFGGGGVFDISPSRNPVAP